MEAPMRGRAFSSLLTLAKARGPIRMTGSPGELRGVPRASPAEGRRYGDSYYKCWLGGKGGGRADADLLAPLSFLLHFPGLDGVARQGKVLWREGGVGGASSIEHAQPAAVSVAGRKRRKRRGSGETGPRGGGRPARHLHEHTVERRRGWWTLGGS